MTTLDKIAEINAQFRERVRLLEVERDAKVRLIRSQCQHERDETLSDYQREFWGDNCIHCGADMSTQSPDAEVRNE